MDWRESVPKLGHMFPSHAEDDFTFLWLVPSLQNHVLSRRNKLSCFIFGLPLHTPSYRAVCPSQGHLIYRVLTLESSASGVISKHCLRITSESSNTYPQLSHLTNQCCQQKARGASRFWKWFCDMLSATRGPHFYFCIFPVHKIFRQLSKTCEEVEPVNIDVTFCV